MDCECCKKDESGNFTKEPCCSMGSCETDSDLGMCIHCGAEMFKEGGFWWHYSQEEIPIKERGMVHVGP